MFRIKTGERTQGIYFRPSGKAVFTVWAPNANRMDVIIRPGKCHKMQRCDYGYWTFETESVREGDRYLFRVDQKDEYPDPASLSQPEGVHGPSEAVDLGNYTWNGSDWEGIALEDLIIYEIHTGTFTPEGTFAGVIGKLGYLKELGVNAIEIMPVSQFPGDRNWGYDGVYVYAVQQSYGGIRGLRDLVQACHAEGIAVILDVVYNHNGPEGNYLPVFGPYFTGKYRIPWGKAVNFDDAYAYGVRQYYMENALMWFRDFRIDVLRLDAVHAIRDFGAEHFLAELSSNVQKLSAATGKKLYLIGECDLNDVKYIDPLDRRGYGLDAQWCDEFHHALHAHVTGERKEYYADFGDISQIAKSMKDAYVYDGTFSSHRKKWFGSSTGNRSGKQFVVFIQNHDQVGNRMLGERLSTLIGHEMNKLLAGTMFLSPYIPLLFMGEEYGETNPFLYFNSHGDPELIRMVREGRKNEFKEFYARGDPADPQDPGTFERSKLSWNFDVEPYRRELLEYYKYWIWLRKTDPVLRSRDRTHIEVKVLDLEGTLAVIRSHGRHRIIAYLNFQKNPFRVEDRDAPDEREQPVINSASTRWGGSVPENTGIRRQDGRILIEGQSLALFTEN